jgi:hypothetical protein
MDQTQGLLLRVPTPSYAQTYACMYAHTHT